MTEEQKKLLDALGEQFSFECYFDVNNILTIELSPNFRICYVSTPSSPYDFLVLSNDEDEICITPENFKMLIDNRLDLDDDEFNCITPDKFEELMAFKCGFATKIYNIIIANNPFTF